MVNLIPHHGEARGVGVLLLCAIFCTIPARSLNSCQVMVISADTCIRWARRRALYVLPVCFQYHIAYNVCLLQVKYIPKDAQVLEIGWFDPDSIAQTLLRGVDTWNRWHIP